MAREEGLFVEPSSAAALAGLIGLQARGAIGAEETIVLMLTGSGLKAPEIVEGLPEPQQLECGLTSHWDRNRLSLAARIRIDL